MQMDVMRNVNIQTEADEGAEKSVERKVAGGELQVARTQSEGTQPAGKDVAEKRGGDKPKLLDSVRHKMRLLHLAKRTEEAYMGWC